MASRKKPRRTPKKPEEPGRTLMIPNEIITEILLRLPAEIVARFRVVCQEWKKLTSTDDFVKAHYMRQRVPAILVQENVDRRMELFLIEKWEEEATQMDLKITNLRPKCTEAFPWHTYFPWLSHDGLVVLQGSFNDSKEKGFRSSFKDFIICNPICQDTVRILTPNGRKDGIFGLFLHPTLEEYCVLWGVRRRTKIEVKMVNLGPKEPQWKEIKAGSPVPCLPCLPQVLIDDVLYWTIAVCRKNRSLSYATCKEFIMAFDIKREEFSVMPHPGQIAGCGPKSHEGMHLLEMDKHLTLVQIFPSDENHSTTTIDIWILIDVAERVWVKRYSINVEEYLNTICTRCIAIVNGELLLQRDYKTFSVYNLQQQCWSKKNFRREYMRSFGALVHYKTLVSLKECKSEIKMAYSTRQTRRTVAL